ncbi:MAG TPA: polysaccharide deacetylase family protein, partial [bacterium]|nr:polysaccharide deacetylase family protein [bacterium]
MSAAKRKIAAAALIVFAALALFGWIRWQMRSGPSPSSDLDVPGLFAEAHKIESTTADVRTPGIPVLCYHYFRPGLDFERLARVLGAVLLSMPTIPDNDFWSVSAPEFERQMRYLHEQGYTTATLAQLEEHLRGGAELPPKSVVLTVDDGDRSFREIAAPILQRYRQRATVFMLTGYSGTVGWNDLRFMDGSTLRQLERSGVARIESHTHRMHTKVRVAGKPVPRFLVENRDPHGDVSTLSPLGNDLQQSREWIREQLGHDPEFLSWPFGFGDAATDSIARVLGF